ncbi:MAG: GMC family oxidoreductase N-terminal domain-containing protein, partial [Nocardioides sp.]|uniref:GMC family oxidoreductase n=1 Tax=Nocardioides sp. TaxID=35761 RepID=UPI003264C4AD
MTTSTASARETFDYVVVGAGASGAALAARLSDDPTISVLVLEAGGPDKKQEVRIPAAFSKLFKTPLDWDYATEPQEHLSGRSIFWPRGKMLGGSTSLNAMMWVRGYAADYDGWAEAAGPEWSYESLLPYFRRVERVEGNTDPDQGSGGAVHIEHQRSPRSHTTTFLTAVKQAGYAVESPNSAQPDGFSETMVSQKRGKRCSTADAYLKPNKGRTNLTVRTDAQAARVIFEDTRAVGLEYILAGATQQVFVNHEVVLSGGAINTPQLLLLSGVGPKADLAALGIDVVVDAPEVGANLQDHLIAALIIESDEDTLFAAEKPAQIVNFLARGRGMLTSNVGEAYGFVR